MNREVHVRNCEGVGVKLPRATRLWQSASPKFPAIPQIAGMCVWLQPLFLHTIIGRCCPGVHSPQIDKAPFYQWRGTP
jgi:hypothetical protein